MDDSENYRNLYHENEDIIVDTLYIYGGSVDKVSPKEKSRILELIDSECDEISERAVFVSGLHFTWYEAVPIIIQLVERAYVRDALLQGILIRSIGAIGRKYNDYKVESLEILNNFANDERYSEDIRGLAFKEVLLTLGKITIREYAQYDNVKISEFKRREFNIQNNIDISKA